MSQKPDYKKVNKTRRSRGYSFEKDIVDAFNNNDGWYAKRLGGTTTNLPDIIVTNPDKSILYSIECKSGESNRLYIPADQFYRCLDITGNFLKNFKYRFVILAYKFKANKNRDLKYRILPLFIDKDLSIITKKCENLKHVSYDIVKDHSIITKTKETKIRVDNPFNSLKEFLNWDVDEFIAKSTVDYIREKDRLN